MKGLKALLSLGLVGFVSAASVQVLDGFTYQNSNHKTKKPRKPCFIRRVRLLGSSK